MLDIAIVSFYMISVLWVGFASGKKVNDLREYATAKSSFSTFVIVATIFATLIGGGATMGVTEKVYSSGIIFLLTCLSFIARDLLTAFFIVPHFDKYENCLSIGDVMAIYYGKTGKIIVGIAGTLQASVYLSMQVAAVGHLLFYFLNVPYNVGIFIGIGAVVLYSSYGGMRAVAFTDAIQFAVLIIAIPLTFSIGIDMVGGFYGLLAQVPDEKLSLLPKNGDQMRFFSLILVFILPNMTPTLAQRFLMGKSAKQVKRALIISAFARIPYFTMVGTLGLVALVLAPNIKPDLAFPYLVNTIIPVGMKGLVISGIMAVIMSTADSLLHVAGLSLAHDVIKPIMGEKLSDKNELILVRLVTFIIGLMALGSAFINTNIIELSVLAYTFWLPVVAFPLVANILNIHAGMRTFLVSSIFGITTFFIWRSFFFSRTHIDSLLPSVLVSALVYFVGFFAAKRKFSWTNNSSSQRLSSGKKMLNNTIVLPSKFLTTIKNGFEALVEQSAQKVEIFGAPYAMFVVFSIINLCFVPFIFARPTGLITPGFVIYLRVTASMFSFLLVMKDFWPQKSLKYLPLFWHITLLFCLPYFAISMCLFSSCSMEWIIDLILIIFILSILVDWKTYVILIISGAFLAGCSFALFGDPSHFKPDFGAFPMMTYAIGVAISAGVLFSRNKERVLMEKLNTFKALGGTIAHEMRTPLSSIQVSAGGLKEYLPALVEAYRLAKDSGLKVQRISQLALESTESIPERMRYTCASALNIIDMLLLQLKDNDWNSHFSECSMKECVEIAMQEYCFREKEKDLVDISGVRDFNFYGNRYLVVHILYNLLRNAFTFINSERRGAITIWTSEGPADWNLHFCDTAKGINKRDLPHIFEHGFSKRSGGSGVGLHYCRRMMAAMSGSLKVNSVEGKYAEFILVFNKNK